MTTEVANVDPRDPNVRRLVYNMYRKMLTDYNDQANDIVDSMPRDIVQEDAEIFRQIQNLAKSQASPGGPPPPPPPPSLPGSVPGRRLKTEIPERGIEPPAAIQNAMMTKDKKPFTYTPGGLDLSEIRSPKMQRRINRNACADEMPGEPAPTSNQLSPPGPVPAQTFPSGVPPPPPPPPPGMPNSIPNPPASVQVPKPSVSPHRPQQGGFDPNEILARVNRNQNLDTKVEEYPNNIHHNEPNRFKEPKEPEYHFEPKQQNEHVFSPRQNEPGYIYVPQIAPKLQNEPGSIYVPTVPANTGRSQLGSIYIPPVTNINQEPNTPSSASSYGYQVQSPPSTASPTSPVSQIELNKAPTPWMNLNKNQQSTVPAWASREPEPSKPSNTRIIPIQIEGRDPPSPVQKQQQPQYQQPQQQHQQQSRPQSQYQQPQYRQQPQQQNTRIIPVQIEVSPQSNFNQQRSPAYGYNQNKFNVATPSSPTPYSPPTAEGVSDQKPQWAPVQPRPYNVQTKSPEMDVTDGRQQQRPQYNENHPQGRPQQRFQQAESFQQPEYGTYNTAGVPLSQLRKMQLSDEDKALMDKFKAQVDDETYLHRESDPRYRGAAIPSRAFRMLQCMTDTVGDMPQQVPRSNLRTPVNRPPSAGQFQQEVPQGPYVPPSEQQVQEPRKYTGGSIPSRSFRMLQAMTGQDGAARNQSSSNSPSGRETPVSGMNRWCPSPAPSPMDPYWGYYPPDPYLIYNYISDLNAAYGFPPPHSYQSNFPSPHFQRCHNNYVSDSDEQGYSSTDELAQYYANYRMNVGYAPYRSHPDPTYYRNGMYESEVEGSPTKSPRAPETPKRNDKSPKVKKTEKPKENGKAQAKTETKKVSTQEVPEKVSKPTEVNESTENVVSDESVSSSSEESESDDTEVEDEKDAAKKIKKSSPKINKNGSLQALKSVSDVNIYTSESSATVTNEEWEDCESKLGDEDQEDEEAEEEEEGEDDDEEEDEEEEEEEEDSSEEEETGPNSEENLPHQLSVIYEESEHSDVESMKRAHSRRSGRSTTKSITSESGDSSLTIDNGEDESDDDVLDSEASVTVRLPLQLRFSRTDKDEDVTTVIVGDSQMKRGSSQVEEPQKVVEIEPEEIEIGNEDEDEDEDDADGYESDEADVSVTFSIPTRSNSVIRVVSNSEDKKDGAEEKESQIPEKEEIKSDDDKVEKEADAEVTVSLSLPLKKPKPKDEKSTKVDQDRLSYDSKTEESDSTHCEDDSSSTSVQSVDTVVKDKEDTDDEVTEKVGDEKKIDSFKSWIDEGNSKDWYETEKTAEAVKNEEKDSSYEAGVGKLEEMISSLLEKTKEIDVPEKGKESNEKLKKKDSKDSIEESEEDDSGVTSDMSAKLTDGDTESDYSELSKMTQFQRASTHSRLFKLLQEECEKSGVDEDEAEEDRTLTRCDSKESKSSTSPVHLDKPESISSRKERLTLPLNRNQSEVESLSSSSGVTSPSSPTVTDRLVKELVQSLLNKKKGRKFRKLPLAKLHAAALRILQEDMDPYDTSSASGDDGFFLSPVQKRVHSQQPPADFVENENQAFLPESVYGENYYDYLDYYNTWGNPGPYYGEAEYEIVPSRAFRLLNGNPCGFNPNSIPKCPRMGNLRQDVIAPSGRTTPAVNANQVAEDDYYGMSFADKRERVSRVLEKSGKT